MIHVYGADLFLDQVIGSDDPSNLYIGLAHSQPNFEIDEIDEPDAGDYERLELVNNSSNWLASENGIKKNAVDIIFPEAENNWGTINTVLVFDHPTEDNLLASSLVLARVVNTGHIVRLPSGLVRLRLK